jgi:hypothetical protein
MAGLGVTKEGERGKQQKYTDDTAYHGGTLSLIQRAVNIVLKK